MLNNSQKTRVHDQTSIYVHYYAYYHLYAFVMLAQISLRYPCDCQNNEISITRPALKAREGFSPTKKWTCIFIWWGNIEYPPLCTLDLVHKVMGFTLGSRCFLATSWPIKGGNGNATKRGNLEKFYVVGIVLEIPYSQPLSTPIRIPEYAFYLPPRGKCLSHLLFNLFNIYCGQKGPP